MKKLLLASLVLLCGCSSHKPRVELIGGLRNFDDSSNWENTDRQTSFGGQVSFASPDGWGPEVGFIHSQDSSNDSNYDNRLDSTKSVTTEIFGGVRKNWLLNENWQLVTSGGMSATMLNTDYDMTFGGNTTSDSVAYVPYLQGGVNYLFDKNWSAGLVYRRNFWGEDNEAIVDHRTTDSNTFLVSVGYGF